MNKYLAFAVLFLIFSCKTKAVLAEGNASNKITASKVIENHYSSKTDFSTLYIKATAHYEDDKNTQNVTADIRIKKDEQILVIIRFLGFTMAKALITPNSVQYYEKIGSNYFEGDYAGLSQWLGTDLDFYKVQNMFIGKALDKLIDDKYQVSIIDKLYKLEDNADGKTFKSYFFEADNFLLKKEVISQPSQDRFLEISYPEYKKYDEMILPLNIAIDATQNKGKVKINIDYKGVTFNEELSFPYEVPDGYERIYIKN
ncbi:MAG: DUF4292 domain-containing protein [Flavobacterium sp.]|nr:DUF4292 domain-containing protein [Flavobacterium sp.]